MGILLWLTVFEYSWWCACPLVNAVLSPHSDGDATFSAVFESSDGDATLVNAVLSPHWCAFPLVNAVLSPHSDGDATS